MAFKKVLSQRLLNITKISSQTLTSCRISSSSVQARIPSSPSNPDIAPDPGDNAIFCRFLQKRPVFQPPFFPKLGENLLHKLKEMDIAKSRIRLDGLTPPVEKSESTEAVTVQDARKLLKVAKAVQYLFPAPGASVRKELEEMEKKKAEIDEKANSLVRRELWGGLGFLMVQTAAFMRLTFWELSWDVMEPICFYVTSIYFMAGYTFFLRTSKEPSFEGYYQSRFSAKQKRLMKLHNFDTTRYNELRAASFPESPSPTALSIMKSHHH